MTDVGGQFDYEALFEGLPSPFMILDRDLRYVGMNQRYLETTGSTRTALIGRYVFEAFPEVEERQKIFEDAFRRATNGEANDLLRVRFDLPEADGGTRQVWWDCHHIPVRNAAGETVGMLQQALDVTAEVRAEQLRAAVMSELDHRVKNVIAKVQAIARRTAIGVERIDDYLQRLDARLSAMGRAQGLLFAGAEDYVPLATLLAAELAPYHGENCVDPDGVEVKVAGGAALSLGLAFHELASNAAKYGAFAFPDARLRIDWSVAADGSRVIIRWIESGVDVRGARGSGFGSTILQRIVPSELDAGVDWSVGDDGVRCIFDLPYDGVAIGEAGPSGANLVAIRAA